MGDSPDIFGEADLEMPGLGLPGLRLDEPAAAPKVDSAMQPYRVLARKYRPQTFAELIGQDAMVRTLGNAIQRDRLAHAFLMTGVRGVGKTIDRAADRQGAELHRPGRAGRPDDRSRAACASPASRSPRGGTST